MTGASSGIGVALAREVAPRCRALVLVARRRAEMEALADELRAAHPKLTVQVESCDLVERAQVDAMLASVEQAELALRALGFRALRVRHYRDTARLEIPIDELADVLARREAVVDGVKAAGYRYVTLDLEGLRSGNLNDALRVRSN